MFPFKDSTNAQKQEAHSPGTQRQGLLASKASSCMLQQDLQPGQESIEAGKQDIDSCRKISLVLLSIKYIDLYRIL